MADSLLPAERRSSRRTPVSFGTVVYYNSLMLPGCELRNLSPEGAYVCTEGRFLPDQAVVDLALPELDTEGGPWRISARVVRSDSEGVGIRLVPADPTELRSLAEALYRLPGR